jgi:alkylated DNA repair dioxygenase AlkB
MSSDLFEHAPLSIPGLGHRADFVTPAEEATLLAHIAQLPLEAARFRQYTARRRIASFGGQYDFSGGALRPAGPVPEFLFVLRERAAGWLGLEPALLTHALVAEYRPGTPLGWHRDVPEFELVFGLSLAGRCRMRFRRYGARTARGALALDLAPRSAYILREEVRWDWQHAIAPTRELRYSVTLRSLREERRQS